MKGWLKLLVLGAVPILAVTMVADQALAADKGSQLIFQSNSDHVNFMSVTNSSDSERLRCWFGTTTSPWKWWSGT